LVVERPTKVPVIEVDQALQKTGVKMEFWFIQEDYGVLRGRVSESQVAIQDLLLSGTEIIDVVGLAARQPDGKLQLAVSSWARTGVGFVGKEGLKQVPERFVEVCAWKVSACLRGEDLTDVV
jgi:hypothetical protein